MKLGIKIFLFICILASTGNVRAQDAGRLSAKAELMDASGKDVGTVLFEQVNSGVNITVDLEGLDPGTKSIHIHEFGLCEAPDFKSAGEHFNPYGKAHGYLNIVGHHAGDLPNITISTDGKCKQSFYTDLITLKPGATNSLVRDTGTSIVVHSEADDYYTDPAGMAGDRIACGVIQRAK